jgi:hypothetical protein
MSIYVLPIYRSAQIQMVNKDKRRTTLIPAALPTELPPCRLTFYQAISRHEAPGRT